MGKNINADSYKNLMKRGGDFMHDLTFRTSTRNKNKAEAGLKILEELTELSIKQEDGKPDLSNLKQAFSMVFFGEKSFAESEQITVNEDNWQGQLIRFAEKAADAFENGKQPFGVWDGRGVSAVGVITQGQELSEQKISELAERRDHNQKQFDDMAFMQIMDDQIAACIGNPLALERAFAHLSGLDRPQAERSQEEQDRFLKRLAAWKAKNAFDCGRQVSELENALGNGDGADNEESIKISARVIEKESLLYRKDQVQTEALNRLIGKYAGDVPDFKAFFEIKLEDEERKLTADLFEEDQKKEEVLAKGKAALEGKAEKPENAPEKFAQIVDWFRREQDGFQDAGKQRSGIRQDFKQLFEEDRRKAKNALDYLQEWTKSYTGSKDQLAAWNEGKTKADQAYHAVETLLKQKREELSEFKTESAKKTSWKQCFGDTDIVKEHKNFLGQWCEDANDSLQIFRLIQDAFDSLAKTAQGKGSEEKQKAPAVQEQHITGLNVKTKQKEAAANSHSRTENKQEHPAEITPEDQDTKAIEAAEASLLTLAEEYLDPEAKAAIEMDPSKVYDYLKIDGQSLSQLYPENKEQGAALFMRLLQDEKNELVRQNGKREEKIGREEEKYCKAVKPYSEYLQKKEKEGAKAGQKKTEEILEKTSEKTSNIKKIDFSKLEEFEKGDDIVGAYIRKRFVQPLKTDMQKDQLNKLERTILVK